ncbi:MAG: fasciclin domain-containing protein [Methanothrix sp.]|nr:fasciclin domain-containing protein [Methanothrix sp.]
MTVKIKRTLPILLLASLASIAFLTVAIGADYGIWEAAKDLGNLNTFSAAIQKADVVGTLNNEGVHISNNTFVVFAPNDQAFKDLPAGTMDALYANNGNLKDLLNYHILNNDDNKYADLTRFTTVETREGDELAISNDNGMTINGARVLGSKAYDHGVVYVIDKVLIPTRVANQLAKDMTQKAQSSISSVGILQALNSAGSLNKFATALQTANLAGWLDGQGTLGTHSGPFTIFAPDDNAFAAIPASSLNNLMNRNESDLQKLLKYHIIEKTDVINMTAPDMIKTSDGESLNVDLKSGTVNGARILSSMRYNNGVVYVINNVLLPNDKNFLNKYGLSLTTP